MGIVYAEIMLKNRTDMDMANKGLIKEQEVRQTTVNALVDTGSGTLVINEALRQKLGLGIIGLRRSILADGGRNTYQVTEGLIIKWKDRETECRAIVVPVAEDVLLGAIPLEDMDLIVNPVRQQLEGAHGDEILMMIK
jgi:clan AA aspartic protease